MGSNFDPKQMQFVRAPRAERKTAEREFRETARAGLIERACNRIDTQRGRIAIPKIVFIGVVLWLAVLGGSVALRNFVEWLHAVARNLQP